MKRRRRSERLKEKRFVANKRQRRAPPELPPEMWHQIVLKLKSPYDRSACMLASKTHPLSIYANKSFEWCRRTMDLMIPVGCAARRNRELFRVARYLRRYMRPRSSHPFNLAFWVREALFAGLFHRARHCDTTASVTGRPTDHSIGMRMCRVRALFFYNTVDRRVHTVVFDSHRDNHMISDHIHRVLDGLGLPSHVGGPIDHLIGPLEDYGRLEAHARQLIAEWLPPPKDAKTTATNPPT